MEAFINELYEQLSRLLQSVDADINAVRGYNLKAELTEEAIQKMKEYIHAHPFDNRDMEIMYFKCWAPRFFKLQIFYTLLYNLERARITISDAASFKAYLTKKRRRVKRFLRHQEELWIYYLLAETNRDSELFIFSSPTKTEDFLTADALYCKNSLLLAKVMAYQEFLPLLTAELDKLETQPVEMNLDHPTETPQFRWKGNKAQATELIYALVKLKCISVGDSDADIKDLVLFFRMRLSLDIENVYDVELHNRKRKKEKAPFLNSLLEAYLGAQPLSRLIRKD